MRRDSEAPEIALRSANTPEKRRRCSSNPLKGEKVVFATAPVRPRDDRRATALSQRVEELESLLAAAFDELQKKEAIIEQLCALIPARCLLPKQ